jgi:nitroreductase
MEVFDVIRTVLAVRAYRDTPLPPDVIDRIVQAGRLTGSAKNSQPWHFVVVQQRDTLRRLGELASTGRFLGQAPLAIAVAVDKTRFAASDASRAIQSMILAAWADGVGSNWAGFMGLEPVKELLGIPADMDLLAVMAFGYPDQPAGKGRKKRKPLGEVASSERFGTPYKLQGDGDE